MRALLSTIGSRGDVQPLVALAIRLRALGHDARLCVPPDFQAWITGLGFHVTPIGPELRKLTAASPAAGIPFTRNSCAQGAAKSAHWCERTNICRVCAFKVGLPVGAAGAPDSGWLWLRKLGQMVGDCESSRRRIDCPACGARAIWMAHANQ